MVYRFDRAIVREPAPSVVDGLRAVDRGAPTLDGVRAEQAAYIAALEDAGVRVDVLPPLDAFPDSLFVEDPALVFTEGAIVLRPGAPSRAGEAAALRPELERRFTRALATLGRKAVVVEPPAGVLHLKTACSLLDETRLLVTRELDALPEFAGFERLLVPAGEEAAANALRVNDRVLLSAGHPRTRDLLAAAGLRVVQLDTQQVGLLDAGLSCLSLRWSTSER
jgi:dimethylargininase